VILAITAGHPAAQQLENLAQEVRKAARGETGAVGHLSRALNLVESQHGGRTASYHFVPGSASSNEALDTYNTLRESYPQVLEILHMAASKGDVETTVEVGRMGRQDSITYSQHDMIKIMPRVLATFRGRVQ
jgi:hypothetical protein